jgi:hypothetical protein
MDILKMIAELRSEKAAVDETLMVLEQLARTQGKRRGRPPSYMSQGHGLRKRKPFSEATKKRMAASQRKRWAAYRKAQKSV